MNFAVGQLVEFERQAGKPKVVAEVVEHHPDDTTSIRPLVVLDETGRPMFEIKADFTFRLITKFLEPSTFKAEE